MHLKLISFPICPFVQRSVITLNYKKVPYDIEYIDLKNKPEWFIKISPLGKVPVLQIDNSNIIFESTVINELIDELNPPITLAKNPIEKAKERAWIAYSDTLMSDMHSIFRNSNDYKSTIANLMSKLSKLEEVISDKGFFKGNEFSILDSSYAPIFFRMQYLNDLINNNQLMKLKKVNHWVNNLLDKDYVKQSVREDFETSFKEFIRNNNSDIEFSSPICKI